MWGMSEKPILFNTDMVRAILDGHKTVTRRAVKLKYCNTHLEMRTDKYGKRLIELQNDEPGVTTIKKPDGTTSHTLLAAVEVKPPYCPGDVLYVRETWFYEHHMEDIQEGEPDLPSGRYSFRYVYRADSPDYPVDVGVYAGGWRPSIHMPREAARLFLRVTGVRVERLRWIYEHPKDCWMEGIQNDGTIESYAELVYRFKQLWDSTIKPADRDRYGWDTNPWVWVIAFEVLPKDEAKGA